MVINFLAFLIWFNTYFIIVIIFLLMTLNTLDKNQDKEKASHDNNSEENLFEEEC